jgi:hypothetical protein
MSMETKPRAQIPGGILRRTSGVVCVELTAGDYLRSARSAGNRAIRPSVPHELRRILRHYTLQIPLGRFFFLRRES